MQPHRASMVRLAIVTACRQSYRYVRRACRLLTNQQSTTAVDGRRHPFRDQCALCVVVFWSLFYNSLVDVYYVADTFMEPMFWFVDNFTRFFGPGPPWWITLFLRENIRNLRYKLFVFSVCSLLSSVVVIAYVIGVPYYWHRNPSLLMALLVVGNWLLVNVAFHYYMATVTPPGFIPEGSIPETVSICKKCISPKPPRAHHCSICNRCILKMDHHCPWMNTCIGHFNHRFFFLFCVYTSFGALFLIIFGYDILADHLGKYKGGPSLNGTTSVDCFDGSCDMKLKPMSVEDLIASNVYDPALPYQYEDWYHGVLTYTGLLCLGVCVALGSLAVWHGKMIARGETSIEAHINRAEAAKAGKPFINPYNFGTHNNWRLFLGVHNGRTWLRHVLLPSSHCPRGDGLQWITVHSKSSDLC